MTRSPAGPDGEFLGYAADLNPTRTERLGHTLRCRPVTAAALAGAVFAAGMTILLALTGLDLAGIAAGAAAAGGFAALITFLALISSINTPLNRLTVRDRAAVQRALRAAQRGEQARVPAALVALAQDEHQRLRRLGRATPWMFLLVAALQLGLGLSLGAHPARVAFNLGVAAVFVALALLWWARLRRMARVQVTAGPPHGPS